MAVTYFVYVKWHVRRLDGKKQCLNSTNKSVIKNTFVTYSILISCSSISQSSVSHTRKMVLLFCLILTFIPPSLGGHVSGHAVNGTLTLGYLLPWSHDWSLGVSTAPAITIAIREVDRRELLPGYRIEWVIRDTWCAVLRGKLFPKRAPGVASTAVTATVND